ncbi:MAG: DEAD/DEAH box helicase, partial [Opitutaceae bacterium]|nr:DEAD/DEAH box helicase [Opitutaceae bacterium]
MPASDLPIYELESSLVTALRSRGRLVVQAPTGSGKSTQIPQMLLRHGFAGEGREIVVLQPRRLATRMLAARVAHELGGRLGDLVGYQIRLDVRVSAGTRIRFVTEGVLLRQMSFDPMLTGIDVIVFDEFHERHLHGDISLARALQIQSGARPDLKIIVMSATLDSDALRVYLSPCEVLVSQGRSFPVSVEYLPKSVNFEERPLWEVALEQCERIAAKTSGDLLVFMPGAYEINRT